MISKKSKVDVIIIKDVKMLMLILDQEGDTIDFRAYSFCCCYRWY